MDGIQNDEQIYSARDCWPQDMSEPPIPSLLAMLICDQIIVDEQTKKKSLIGIFDNINSLAFPASVNCAIYAKMADAEGGYDRPDLLVQKK